MGVLDEKRDEYNSKTHEIDVKLEGIRQNIEGVVALIQSVDSRISELEGEEALQNQRIAELRESRKNIDAKKAEGAGESEKLVAKLDELYCLCKGVKRLVESERTTLKLSDSILKKKHCLFEFHILFHINLCFGFS